MLNVANGLHATMQGKLLTDIIKVEDDCGM